MKKMMILLFFIIANSSLNTRPADFVPEGANWRIDIYPHLRGCTMNRYEVSRYYDEEGNLSWGQGQCSLPGTECHCYDWLTWWFGVAWVPDPPKEWESIYGNGEIPIYNPITNTYEYQ